MSDEPVYLGLRDLSVYAGLCVRTLRKHLVADRHPLPHYRIGTKILVRRDEYDAWARGFRRAGPAIVNDVAALYPSLEELRQRPGWIPLRRKA